MSYLFLFLVLNLILAVGLAANSMNSEYVPGEPKHTPVELSRFTFQNALEDPANSLWLLKFYAPW
jgi:hypothetical protein